MGSFCKFQTQEMLKVMAEEHGAKFCMPEMKLCGDNGVMIAWLGLIMHNQFGPLDIKDTGIIQRFRTDEVEAPWVNNNDSHLKLPDNLIAKGAESDIIKSSYLGKNAVLKVEFRKLTELPRLIPK